MANQLEPTKQASVQPFQPIRYATDAQKQAAINDAIQNDPDVQECFRKFRGTRARNCAASEIELNLAAQGILLSPASAYDAAGERAQGYWRNRKRQAAR